MNIEDIKKEIQVLNKEHDFGLEKKIKMTVRAFENEKFVVHYNYYLLDVLVHHRSKKYTEYNDIVLATIKEDYQNLYNEYIELHCVAIFERDHYTSRPSVTSINTPEKMRSFLERTIEQYMGFIDSIKHLEEPELYDLPDGLDKLPERLQKQIMKDHELSLRMREEWDYTKDVREDYEKIVNEKSYQAMFNMIFVHADEYCDFRYSFDFLD